ncbi:MAG: hypothetical protein H7333_00490 [Bdellovibrionales bacterium]|nr:hypothetical protein [Oligoflexia bacterium]
MKLRFLPLLLLGATACNSPGTASTAFLNPAHEQDQVSTPASAASPGPVSTPAAVPVVNVKPAPVSPPVKATRAIGIVWNGDGACTDGCIQGGVTAVNDVGLTLRYVNQNTPATTPAQIAEIFADAKVWVMPGGHSLQEVQAMTPALRNGLRQFVANGGGYVGWCAGAFSATDEVGTTGEPGLGLMPGSSKVFISSNKRNAYGASIEKLSWISGAHDFYLEGGPYLYNLASSVEVIARYPDQVSIAAARTAYGNGRVYISGVHPEAPIWWWSGTAINDPDGSDAGYAADMLRWAARLE